MRACFVTLIVVVGAFLLLAGLFGLLAVRFFADSLDEIGATAVVVLIVAFMFSIAVATANRRAREGRWHRTNSWPRSTGWGSKK